ncbi:phosphatidate cytidylyltransferase [Undibacterium umbellatum]|uniref:Phosphatidate cytidylyltransferase n=1 Tax=Undibacterium umbellatum TaxID=2762300 RepID=A0ABR6ZA35_9BURK|nr:phosphatidate cytidylyltransferase [Undibacterium umbellatum]MBC3908625.1 phosphatidate cytidylyltransferase [Undibacterium umbellatum]
MLPKFLLGNPTLGAMLMLYLLLAFASVGVGRHSSPESQLRKQVNAWWFLFPVVSLSLFLYPVGPLLMVLLIVVLAVRELSLHYSGPRWRFFLPCLILLLLQASLQHAGNFDSSLILPALLFLQALQFFIWRQRNHLLLMLFLLLCYGLGFMLELLALPFSNEVRMAWFFYLCVVTALNDIAQFVSGKIFGKQTIAPTISPNKTVQGLIGGVLISMLVSTVLGMYLDLASPTYLMMMGILLSIGGFVGDLIFSAAKRYLKIKDFSELIPGHGGILDRVDSLVLTAPLLYLALLF